MKNIVNVTVIDEQKYVFYLKSFLISNKSANQFDYVLDIIEHIEHTIKLNKSITDEKLKSEILKTKPTYIKEADINIWFNQELQNKKKSIQKKILVLRSNLLFFKIKIDSLSKPQEKSIIDLSNTKGTEKIIMLEKLGILDYLKEKQPFNASKNALASALSGITGIDTKTLQSYINPINNPTVNQKNNPLNSEKSVNKVIQKLLSIGYKST